MDNFLFWDLEYISLKNLIRFQNFKKNNILAFVIIGLLRFVNLKQKFLYNDITFQNLEKLVYLGKGWWYCDIFVFKWVSVWCLSGCALGISINFWMCCVWVGGCVIFEFWVVFFFVFVVSKLDGGWCLSLYLLGVNWINVWFSSRWQFSAWVAQNNKSYIHFWIFSE